MAPNSPDLGRFAYNVCGVMQQRVYQTPIAIKNADELKKTKKATGLEQNIINAINEWRKHLQFCLPVFTQRADILNIFC